MTDEMIQAMHEFDWNCFKSDRVEAIHTQELDLFTATTQDNMESPLLDRFLDRLSVPYDCNGAHSFLWWIEEIEDPSLLQAVLHCTPLEKKILTLLFVNGCTQKKCAEILHVSPTTLNYRLTVLMNKLRKFVLCEKNP